jgi:hypothetical protein
MKTCLVDNSNLELEFRQASEQATLNFENSKS